MLPQSVGKLKHLHRGPKPTLQRNVLPFREAENQTDRNILATAVGRDLMRHYHPLEPGSNTFHEQHDELHNTHPFEHPVHRRAVCKHAAAIVDARYWQQRQTDESDLQHL